MSPFSKPLAAAALIAGALAAAAGLAPAAQASTTCSLYASPSGSDSNSGQLSAPLQSVAALDAALSPGQTGCLESGTYGSISTVARLTASGTASGQITITAAPGQSPTIVGLVELEGSYTTLSGLTIDGSNDLYDAERSGTTCPYPVSNGLEIDGQHDIFQYNDFYQSVPSLRGNGIGIGWNGQADDTIVRYNRIHDLGQCDAYDQMIYLARGNDVQIYDNWMWDDPHGWGVQIYPAAADAHVYDNVIDGAGSGVVIAGDSTVQGNVVDHNVVINSTGLVDAGLAQGVGISSSGPIGPGNVFDSNDVFDDPGGVANAPGVQLSDNITSDPQLNDPAAHDYRPLPGSPVASWGLWDGGLGAITAPSGSGSTGSGSTGSGTTGSGTSGSGTTGSGGTGSGSTGSGSTGPQAPAPGRPPTGGDHRHRTLAFATAVRRRRLMRLERRRRARRRNAGVHRFAHRAERAHRRRAHARF
ncbi:MAG TPA: hypothetical protein VKV27_14640 [Solirubrobacteraceae bacterium]|nr:hypothetical protein [Solirubrobacteraceae bacterium]